MRAHNRRACIFLKTLVVILLVGATVIPAASAAEGSLTVTNDAITSNPRPDDLYTSDLRLGVEWGGRQLIAGERMFTDRVAGYRFDESYLAVAFPDHQVKGWDVALTAGALHVGEGLLGQRVQNHIHRAVGSEEVNLSYIQASRVFPTIQGDASRSLGRLGALDLTAHANTYSAPGFRSWARFDVTTDQRLGWGFALHYGAGARADLIESDWLEGHIDGISPTAYLGVSYRTFEVRWSYNDYGTGTPHISVGFRPPDRRTARSGGSR